MQSLWECTAEIPSQDTLTQDIQVDVAVIGGGMAGILTACLLRESGADVIVLEANTVASGQTKNTTAKITSQHDLIYDTLISQHGKELAQQYANANQAAIEEYDRLINQHNIACDFERLPAHVYSTTEPKPLLKELRAVQALGLPASYTENNPLPFPITGAIRFDNQAQFHPLRFLQEMVKHVTISEQTRVISVEEELIKTNSYSVRAHHIVFATHYPFINTPGYYFMRMHQERSYVLALEGTQPLDGMYIGMAEQSLSFRNYGSLLLLGGGDHRTGENSAGGKYDSLAKAAKTYFPNSKEVYRWSAQDCMPLDEIPYIGKYSDSTPNWYVATGFKKWGMSSSMVAAMLLRDAIQGKENPNAEIFSPQRSFTLAATPTLLTEGAQSVKGLLREKLSPPRAAVEELLQGHGGIVEAEDGVKIGVYKDDTGNVYTVDTRCPHLGCQLEWNPDEKSWECPCHGSRFDYTGRLQNGPAQTNVSAE